MVLKKPVKRVFKKPTPLFKPLVRPHPRRQIFRKKGIAIPARQKSKAIISFAGFIATKIKQFALRHRLAKIRAAYPAEWTTGMAAHGRRGTATLITPFGQQVERYKQQGLIQIVGGRNIISGRTWRGAPGPLGDVVIVEVMPTPVIIMEAQKPGSMKGMGGKQINWETAWKTLNEYYHFVVNKTKEWIGFPFPRREGGVPTDTGKLRQAMWRSMEREWGGKTKMPMSPPALRQAASRGQPLLTIVLNTKGINYAAPVNQMPTRMLAHPHAGSRNWGRAGFLVDPQAVTWWFLKAATVGRDRARQGAYSLLQSLGQVTINYS